MNTTREAVLLGTREASELHDALRMRQKVEDFNGAIDIFGAIETLEIPLLFRPLDKLLGACIRQPGAAGIMVTSQRDLHLQRFTAAHELGHVVLEHEGSLDREIRLPGEMGSRDVQEIAADAFAAEFLLPKWLCIHHAKRHRWTKQRLGNPATVYQLSLRMSVSYDATCMGLLSHNVLDRSTVDRLRKVTPKRIKQQLLNGAKLDDPWADVWELSERDNDTTILAGPHDVFLAVLTENSGAGYLWEAAGTCKSSFRICNDAYDAEPSDSVGGSNTRRIMLSPSAPGIHQLALQQLRPWEKSPVPLSSLSISVSTYGAEAPGLPRSSHPSTDSALLH